MGKILQYSQKKELLEYRLMKLALTHLYPVVLLFSSSFHLYNDLIAVHIWHRCIETCWRVSCRIFRERNQNLSTQPNMGKSYTYFPSKFVLALIWEVFSALSKIFSLSCSGIKLFFRFIKLYLLYKALLFKRIVFGLEFRNGCGKISVL